MASNSFIPVAISLTGAAAAQSRPFAFKNLAGSPGSFGNTPGTGTGARFHEPYHIAMDAAGNAYVADFRDHVIRKMSPNGVVTNLGGSPGTLGSDNGLGAAANFNFPAWVAVDVDGMVYVADTANHTIRKISGGITTTIGGTAFVTGTEDGTGAAARFNKPAGIALGLGAHGVGPAHGKACDHARRAKCRTVGLGRAISTDRGRGNPAIR